MWRNKGAPLLSGQLPSQVKTKDRSSQVKTTATKNFMPNVSDAIGRHRSFLLKDSGLLNWRQAKPGSMWDSKFSGQDDNQQQRIKGEWVWSKLQHYKQWEIISQMSVKLVQFLQQQKIFLRRQLGTFLKFFFNIYCLCPLFVLDTKCQYWWMILSIFWIFVFSCCCNAEHSQHDHCHSGNILRNSGF